MKPAKRPRSSRADDTTPASGCAARRWSRRWSRWCWPITSCSIADNAAEMNKATRRLRIYGRVQGVFYRNWSLEQAQRLDLAGWVRNRSDGSVELLVSGPEDKVAAMTEACGQGPP